MFTRGNVLARLAVGLAVVAALGLLGRDVERKLEPISLTVPGTASGRGQALADRYFDNSAPLVILLRGPSRQVDRQGRRLAAVLRSEADATTISPWDRGAVPGLRPGPRRALILVDLHLPLAEAMRDAVPRLEGMLQRRIQPPVEAVQSGFATISRALQVESQRATEHAELLAAPLLILVLLLVFRSLVAAAIPLAMGALTVIAGRGVLAALSSLMAIDSLSLAVCSMMGLALGVDYSLLIVSRFREELADGHEARSAARRARASAGRTTAFAGLTLFVAIFVSAFLQPGLLLASMAAALVVVTAISIALATLVLPPFLALLGERINAGRFRLPFSVRGGRRQDRRSLVSQAATAALRRPLLAALLIAVPLLALAMPALGFDTGPPSVGELPPGSPARQDAEEISSAIGPGWTSPFVLVTASPAGPVTAPKRLASLARWQRRIAAQDGVKAVVGPARLSRSTAPLRRLASSLKTKRQAELRRMARLGPGLRRAGNAVARLRSGLSRASVGSDALASGAGRAQHGASLIADGAGRAAAGGARAGSGARRLATGMARLAESQRQAGVAGLSLTLGLDSLYPGLDGEGAKQAQRLASELERDAGEDPSLRAVASRARRLAQSLAASRSEAGRLRTVAEQLNQGLNRMGDAGKRLAAGADRLAEGVPALEEAFGGLEAGAGRLAANLGRLEGGAQELGRGLSGGYSRATPLQARLLRAGTRATSFAEPLTQASRLRRRSPGIFNSGYLVLSAIDGASRPQRALAGEAVNIAQGGAAARMLIVSDHDFNTAGSRRVGALLVDDARRIERSTGMVAGVTGGAAVLEDYGSATRARLPLAIGAVIALTFLMLIAILRAPLLAALTVGLNLVTVSAAVGVMTLASRIPAGYPLGGHPYIDTIGAAIIFGVTFGLSIDYAMFLLARVKERHDRGRDNRMAILFGIERTAAVITGAAVIMAAVFACFAIAPIATVGQLGLGLTVAILLDATLIRIVLLPALMLLIGERVWYVPPALDRLLPKLNIGHGPLRDAET